MFESRKFKEGVLVDIRLKTEYINAGLIGELSTFILENELFNIGGGATKGRGMYIAFHTKEDAAKIEKFVKDWMKNGQKNSV